MKKYSLPLFLVLALIHINSFADDLNLQSSAFTMNAMMPADYTCEGADTSPPLSWSNVPAKTQSLVLIAEDPNAANGTWTHWVLFNIPPTVTKLDAGAAVPEGATSGKNSWESLGYRGPCPPIGAHSYVFKLYAVDKVLDLGEGTTNDLVSQAITGHVIGSSKLVGLYQK